MKKLFTLAAALLLMGSAYAQLYNLVKVTEVNDGGLYVFERNGHVLYAKLDNKAVVATDEYNTTGLTGKESYVWSLEANVDGSFSIRSEQKYADNPDGHIYLNNPSGKTDITMANAGSAAWKFTFEGGEVLISNANNADRFLGETADGSNKYKAYAASNIDTYGHNFTVYELQVSTSPYITIAPAVADFGAKAIGSDAVTMDITVNCGNLKGSVTYSGLKDPFSAKGTIAKSGDKLTITANPSKEGTYSQTLTIESATDNVKVQVTVKMNVTDPTAGYAKMTGKMVEGDYVLTYDEYAMKASIMLNSKNEKVNRFENGTFTLSGDMLTNPDESIIWHIASAGDSWTLYNKSVNKYAGSTDAKNQGALLDDATTDNAKWNITVTEANTYEFENVARAASEQNPENKWLHNNATYGFACYGTNTGGALTLYRLGGSTATAVEQTEMTEKPVKVFENGQVVIIRGNIRYNLQGVRVP